MKVFMKNHLKFLKIVNNDYTDNDLIDYEALVTIIEDKNFNEKSENK